MRWFCTIWEEATASCKVYVAKSMQPLVPKKDTKRSKASTATRPSSSGGDSPAVSCSLNPLHNQKGTDQVPGWRNPALSSQRLARAPQLAISKSTMGTKGQPNALQDRCKTNARRCPRRTRSPGGGRSPGRRRGNAAVTSPGRAILSRSPRSRSGPANTAGGTRGPAEAAPHGRPGSGLARWLGRPGVWIAPAAVAAVSPAAALAAPPPRC